MKNALTQTRLIVINRLERVVRSERNYHNKRGIMINIGPDRQNAAFTENEHFLMQLIWFVVNTPVVKFSKMWKLNFKIHVNKGEYENRYSRSISMSN